MGKFHAWLMPATFVSLLLASCCCAKESSARGSLAGVTVSDMREFLQATNYTVKAPREVTTHHYAIQNRECSLTISYPTMGYSGDMTVPPRMARTRAKIEGFAEGAGCVTEREEGSVADLTEGFQIVVLVDGMEESIVMSPSVKLLLPGLETGSHIVEIRVLDVNDQVVAQAGPLEFITLPDVQFLFPDLEHTFQLEDKVMLAISVSPTALDNHVCDASPPLPTGGCAVPQADRAVGLRITINGVTAANIIMSPEDGDDGRRTYHVDLGQMDEGEYQIGAVMTAEGGSPDIGEWSWTSFAVAQCAKLGRTCEQLEGVKGAESLYQDCPPVSRDWCVEGCSGHGECQAKVCVCEGDWIGDKCGHDLRTNATYMPEIDPHHWQGRCRQVVAWGKGAREIIHQLEVYHHRNRCSADDLVVFKSRMHGVGAQVHYLTECVTTAWLQDKGAVVGMPLDGVSCKNQIGGHSLLQELFACHLEPYTECKVPGEVGESDLEEPLEGYSKYDGGLGEKGAFWWRAHLAWFLITPGPYLLSSLRQAKWSLGWHLGGGPVIGVHVRHGDSCAHAQISNFRPQCVPFSAYLERIKEIGHKYGARRIFLATDDAAVVTEAKGALGEENVMSVDLDRVTLSGDWLLEFRTQERTALSAQDVTGSALLDLLLLQDCDYFVGTFASHLSRLAFELMVARLGYFPPYSSVDYPWCFSFLEKDDVPGYGLVNC